MIRTPSGTRTPARSSTAELAEHFWSLTPEEAERLATDPDARPDLADEVADVANYLLRLVDVLDLHVAEVVRHKLQENERWFPPERVRGRATFPPAEGPE